MDNIILGLLLLQPRTIYQLRKRINDGLNLMYSCSTGSIQAAIKKLLQSDCIGFNDVVENGKLKKVYFITDKGKSRFDSWVNSAIESDKVKNSELSKIYFMGFADEETRVKSIANYIKDLEKLHSDLDKICKEGEKMPVDSQGNDILFYQLQTAKYGRDFMRFNIDFYSRLLENIRSSRNGNSVS